MSNLAHFGTLWLAQHTCLYWSETVTWTGGRLLSTKGKEYLRCSSCQKTRRVIEISTLDTTPFPLPAPSRLVIYVSCWRLWCLAGRTVLKVIQEFCFLKQVWTEAEHFSGPAVAGWSAGTPVHLTCLSRKKIKTLKSKASVCGQQGVLVKLWVNSS